MLRTRFYLSAPKQRYWPLVQGPNRVKTRKAQAIGEHGAYSARVRIAVASSASHGGNRRVKGGMMAAGAKPDHAETSLLNLPPNLRQRQIALGIVLILPVGFAVTALLATTPLPQVARGAFLMRLSPPSPKARDWALHFAG